MTNKPQDEWSEEEQKAAKEYERKVKELNDEREKYRKVRWNSLIQIIQIK